MSTIYGIHSAHTTGGLIGLSALSKSLELVAWSISYINGIDFTGIRILNILIPLGAAAVIIYSLSKKQIKSNSVSIAFFVTALAVVAAAVVSGNMVDKTSARYLVLTVPLMILILGMGIAGIDVKTKKQKNLLNFYFGILIIAISFNTALMVKSAIQTITRSYDVSDVNENATGTNVPKADTQYIHDSSLVNILDYKIIDTLKSKGLTKGYSNYWRSNILTYLSNESVDVNSIVCEGQDRYPEPYKWLSTSEDYRPSHIDRTYIIYDDAYLNYVSSCNKEKLGEPLERFNITSRVVVEVYKGDIARTF